MDGVVGMVVSDVTIYILDSVFIAMHFYSPEMQKILHHNSLRALLTVETKL